METPAQVCKRCVLDSSIPGISFDEEGVCNVCNEFDTYKEPLLDYFGTEDQLPAQVSEWCKGRESSDYQVLLLFSGGKDSTYALSRLVDFGVKVLACAFDHEYLAPVARDKIMSVCDELEVDSLVLQTDKIKEIFRETLKQEYQVCSGCWRAMISLSFELAHQKRIPVVLDGLSRGQIVDKRLHKFYQMGIQEVSKIDDLLDTFFRATHQREDAVGQLLARPSIQSGEAFDQVRHAHFFRYSDVSKDDMMTYLEKRFPSWTTPPKVGAMSTNCLIDDVGIHAHLVGRGYHLYKPETAWEIRLGHRDRDEALEWLAGEVDTDRVKRILSELEED